MDTKMTHEQRQEILANLYANRWHDDTTQKRRRGEGQKTYGILTDRILPRNGCCGIINPEAAEIIPALNKNKLQRDTSLAQNQIL